MREASIEGCDHHLGRVILTDFFQIMLCDRSFGILTAMKCCFIFFEWVILAKMREIWNLRPHESLSRSQEKSFYLNISTHFILTPTVYYTGSLTMTNTITRPWQWNVYTFLVPWFVAVHKWCLPKVVNFYPPPLQVISPPLSAKNDIIRFLFH